MKPYLKPILVATGLALILLVGFSQQNLAQYGPRCLIQSITIHGPTEGKVGTSATFIADAPQTSPPEFPWYCIQSELEFHWSLGAAPSGTPEWKPIGQSAILTPMLEGEYLIVLEVYQVVRTTAAAVEKALIGNAQLKLKVTGSESQATSSSCTTEFSGSSLPTGFTSYIPKTGPTFSLSAHSGFLRFNLPGSTTYDQWTNLDEAPQLRCSAPSGDWVVSTRLKLIAPTANGVNYHTGLLVVFSQFDILTWGIYQGNEIRLERTGVRPGISRPLANPNDELELQIEKRGTSYTLRERQAGSSSWTEVGKYEAKESPQFVGLVAKTWSALALTADFDYLTVGRP